MVGQVATLSGCAKSSRFEKKDRHLPQVEVDEMFRLVGYVGAEIATDDAVPSWARKKNLVPAFDNFIEYWNFV